MQTVASDTDQKYRILGVNDDRTECVCCGRTGLKRVVWIENIHTGDVGHFGTTCATKPSRYWGAESGMVKKAAIAKAEHEWGYGYANRVDQKVGNVAREIAAAEYVAEGGMVDHMGHPRYDESGSLARFFELLGAARKMVRGDSSRMAAIESEAYTETLAAVDAL